jgi:hypothetical protein
MDTVSPIERFPARSPCLAPRIEPYDGTRSTGPPLTIRSEGQRSGVLKQVEALDHLGSRRGKRVGPIGFLDLRTITARACRKYFPLASLASILRIRDRIHDLLAPAHALPSTEPGNFPLRDRVLIGGGHLHETKHFMYFRAKKSAILFTRGFKCPPLLTPLRGPGMAFPDAAPEQDGCELL